MSETVETARGLAGRPRDNGSASRLPKTGLIVMGVIVSGVGLWLRFYCPSALWLDETISVNISRLPLDQIPAALRQDGAPPLYYVMLHYWMRAFGQGDFSVRALSGVTSVVTLPFFWSAGRRLGGRSVAWITYFLAVSSPFLAYYATMTRMYALMVLLSVIGFIIIARALEHPSPGRLVLLALVTAAILYTHYWGLYLVGMTGLWLLYHVWRQRRGLPTRQDPTAVRRCFGVMVLGSLLFVPWAPIFIFQTLHTGTPWTGAAGPGDVLKVFGDYAGTGPWAELLAFLYFLFLCVGVFCCRPRPSEATTRQRADRDGGSTRSPIGRQRHDRAGGSGDAEAHEQQLAADLDAAAHEERLRAAALRGVDRVVGFAGFGPGGAGSSDPRRETTGTRLVVRLNPRNLPIFGVLLGTLTVAMVAGAIAQAAFVQRYTAVVIPLFLLLVASGLALFRERKLVVGALAVMCVAGLFTGYAANSVPRSQAVQVAQVLNAQARPGDLVLYCPDQLGPAVDRLLKVPGVTELTFPRAIGPQRVDWINYLQKIDHTDVETFAQDVLSHVGPNNSVWLVWNRSYTGFGSDCSNLETWLSYFQGTGTTVLHENPTFYEYEQLTRYPSQATAS